MVNRVVVFSVRNTDYGVDVSDNCIFVTERGGIRSPKIMTRYKGFHDDIVASLHGQ